MEEGYLLPAASLSPGWALGLGWEAPGSSRCRLWPPPGGGGGYGVVAPAPEACSWGHRVQTLEHQ